MLELVKEILSKQLRINAAGNHVNIDREYARADKSKPIVVFGSFQDLLGTNESGGIKAKNEFIHTDNWDLVIFDEYHFGAWRENAKKLFENPDDEEAADFDAEKYQLEEAGNAYNEAGVDAMADLNPQLSYDAAIEDPYVLKRKSVRGGSWKDPMSYIRSAWRT